MSGRRLMADRRRKELLEKALPQTVDERRAERERVLQPDRNMIKPQ